MLTNKKSLISSGTSYSENDSGCSLSPCENGGTCKDLEVGYQCTCPVEPVAYMGINCELLYDACIEHKCPAHMTCTGTPGLLEYQCVCTPGSTGADCDSVDECESSPCTAPGFECVDSPSGYTCRCQLDGEGCQAESSVCSSQPCLNNGTCVEAAGGFRCLCLPGFSGATCGDDIDECASGPCRNGAICRDSAGQYSCFCVPGFQGSNCEIDIDECASRPCRNHGTCLNHMDHYQCHCAPGYAGTAALPQRGGHCWAASLPASLPHCFTASQPPYLTASLPPSLPALLPLSLTASSLSIPPGSGHGCE